MKNESADWTPHDGGERPGVWIEPEYAADMTDMLRQFSRRDGADRANVIWRGEVTSTARILELAARRFNRFRPAQP